MQFINEQEKQARLEETEKSERKRKYRNVTRKTESLINENF